MQDAQWFLTIHKFSNYILTLSCDNLSNRDYDTRCTVVLNHTLNFQTTLRPSLVIIHITKTIIIQMHSGPEPYINVRTIFWPCYVIIQIIETISIIQIHSGPKLYTKLACFFTLVLTWDDIYSILQHELLALFFEK